MAMLAAGQVAGVMMAGGQGTRLGFDRPKGMYKLGLPSGHSLFEVFAERVARLRALAGRGAPSPPWYVMTSSFTHDETVAYFRENRFFGLPEESVRFVTQAAVPCLRADGTIILESAGVVATSPNGNGGVYEALDRGGALEDMRRRGVRYVHVFGVDNVVCKVMDPVLVGFADVTGAEVVNKTVAKDSPHEKVGVMCLRNGVPSVVEYSEITKEMAESRNPAGDLLYRDGNIANHVFSLDFVSRMVTAELPFHLAHKKIPFADPATGLTTQPGAPNGYKLEMFVFDVFGFSQRVRAFGVAREGEFTPLKNASGPGVRDSPETALADVTAYSARLVEKAGGRVVFSRPDAPLEVCPSISYDIDDLDDLRRQVEGREVVAPAALKKDVEI